MFQNHITDLVAEKELDVRCVVTGMFHTATSKYQQEAYLDHDVLVQAGR